VSFSVARTTIWAGKIVHIAANHIQFPHKGRPRFAAAAERVKVMKGLPANIALVPVAHRIQAGFDPVFGRSKVPFYSFEETYHFEPLASQ
jgi:hypothetical protein